MRQRGEGNEAHPVFLRLVQQAFGLRLPVKDIVTALMQETGNVPVPEVFVGKGGRFCRVVGDAHVESLSHTYDIYQRLHGFFQRGVGVEAVGIEQVHILQIHPFKALIETGDQILAGPPFAIGAGPHVVTSLGRDEQFVPIGRERLLHDLAKGLFGRSVTGTVIVGQVKVHNAMVEGVVSHLEGVGKRVHVSEVVPQAQGDFGNLNAAAAASAVADTVGVTV